MGTVDYRFDDEVAFVTGAAGGMGRATALAFAAAGATVIAVDVNREGLAETADLSAGERVHVVEADVSDPEAVEQAVGIAAAAGRLTCCVNAAAIENEVGGVHETTVEAFDRMQAVNLRGVFLCMKSQLDVMLGSGGGAIVNIASTNSYRPQPHQPAYTASKFGVLGLTKQAALDYGPKGVRINAICPGAIDTPMLRNAMARRGRDAADVAGRLSLTGEFGLPDDIAQAALWLCSPGSAYTFGHAVAVDGGYLAR